VKSSSTCPGRRHLGALPAFNRQRRVCGRDGGALEAFERNKGDLSGLLDGLAASLEKRDIQGAMELASQAIASKPGWPWPA